MVMWLKQNCKTVVYSRRKFQQRPFEKNGSVADINLLLITMLRHENLDTNPLLLSTRDNGFINELYPLMNRFNYVIARVAIEDKVYYLDATHPLGFGKLTGECYNGAARVITKEPDVVYFDADSLREQKFTNVFIINNITARFLRFQQASITFAF